MSTAVTSLDPRYYTDPEVFRVEQEWLFANTWQFAFHASELVSPGDYLCFDIAGDSLFAVLGRDDVIRVFHNVCQHRAHQLLEGMGHLRNSIVCPYHAWTYELTGALRSGPGLASVPGVDRSSISLSMVRSENFCGFVFVNIDGSASSMDDMFPRVRLEIQEVPSRVGAAEAARMARNSRALQLEGFDRKLFRVLPLPAQSPDVFDRGGQAGNRTVSGPRGSVCVTRPSARTWTG